MSERESWNEYFMKIAFDVMSRSMCLRRKVGAILVRDKRILATGYNGPPRGMKHCEEIGGCVREKLGVPSGARQEICRALHAENNCFIQAAGCSTDVSNSILYCTNQPCSYCARELIQLGIRQVFIKDPYNDEFALALLGEGKVVVYVVGDDGDITRHPDM